MNRRDFLKVLGALGIATQLPELAQQQIEAAPLAPITPEFTSLFDGQMFKITFPDGQVYSFKGIIDSIRQNAPLDGLMSADVTVRPIGPVTISGPSHEPEETDYRIPIENGVEDGIPVQSRGTIIHRGGEVIGELQEIVLPTLARTEYEMWSDDETSYVIPGLKRSSPMTFSMTFSSDDGPQKLIEDFFKEGK